jgi:hypothetical protein
VTLAAVIPTPGAERGGTGLTQVPDPYPAALAYLLALVRAEVPLHIERAITATAILEAHRLGLTDSRRSWEWRSDGRPIDITILRPAA